MKISLVVIISMLLNSFNAFATQPNSKRMLLSYLRGGDYAHPGDTEAIDIVLDKIIAINPDIASGNSLDIGCGLGGTLEYLKGKGFKNLYGIDIDQNSITYAQKKYPGIIFDPLDAIEVASLFLGKKFDLVMLFNSIYAIKDKTKLLAAITKISKPGTILAIFDYSIFYQNKTLPVLDFSGNQMRPVELNSLLIDLEKYDWNLVEAQDLTPKFITWYDNFLVNLHKQKNELKQKFLDCDIEQIDSTFSYFLNLLKTDRLGGIAIYATKK